MIRLKLLFLLLSLTILVFADEAKMLKALNSEIRSEVYAQNLVDGGYYEDAQTFLITAREKYPESAALLMFSGRTAYELNNLEEAKKFYVRSLQLEPNNEQATEFVKLIEQQEEAKENKSLSQLFEYLSDKGLDFLMIFLAFLGGEIIAKKYARCTTDEVLYSVQTYFNREKLASSYVQRLLFLLAPYRNPTKFISFCTFLNMIVVFTIAAAVLIVWLMIELVAEVTIFLPDSLTLLTTEQLWSHTLYSLLVFIVLTLTAQRVMELLDFEDKESRYELATAELLQKLALDHEYVQLYEMCELLFESDEFDQEAQASLLKKCFNPEAKTVITSQFEDFNK